MSLPKYVKLKRLKTVLAQEAKFGIYFTVKFKKNCNHLRSTTVTKYCEVSFITRKKYIGSAGMFSAPNLHTGHCTV